MIVAQLGSAQVVFFNKGPLVVKGSDSSNTLVYIDGSMKVSGDESETSEIEVSDARIKLLGSFINDVPVGSIGGTIFVSPVAGHEGVFEFCGNQPQNITTTGTDITNSPSKLHNYINFPNIDINNNKHVTINPRMAVKTKNIELTKGWLVVDSEFAQAQIHGGNEVNPNKESVLAHLLVDGSINYNQATWGSKSAEDRGFIQVNLKVPNEGDQTEKSILGFGSPFKNLRADYFMFNTILEPVAAGFLANPAITDPTAQLIAGRGYVAGIDLRGSKAEDYPELSEYEGIIDFAQRSTGNYRFNRSNFALYAPKNQVFGSNPSSSAYTDETLNTEDITVQLTEGITIWQIRIPHH